jgi:hypothetical protein
MIRRSLADLCRRLASWLEPSPIEEAIRHADDAIRRADDARAIRMEFERQTRPHLTPFQRKLRAGK